MFTIVVGEDTGYGQRLGKYLEAHWKEPLRVFSFTSVETLLECKEPVDCYLLGEGFYRELLERDEGGQGVPVPFEDRVIILSGRDEIHGQTGSDSEARYFCIYHAPAELIHMINHTVRKESGNFSKQSRKTCVTAIYSPVFDPELRRIAAVFMMQGDLYLGMEDVGDFHDGYGHMGDLCYYMGLGVEHCSANIKELAWEEEGRWYVDPPGLYYDLLEIDTDEYRQLFHALKDGDTYGNLYVGLGSGVLAHLYPDILFDRFILVDSRENRRQQAACDYFEQAIRPGVKLFTRSCERRCREDILYDAVQ